MDRIAAAIIALFRGLQIVGGSIALWQAGVVAISLMRSNAQKREEAKEHALWIAVGVIVLGAAEVIIQFIQGV